MVRAGMDMWMGNMLVQGLMGGLIFWGDISGIGRGWSLDGNFGWDVMVMRDTENEFDSSTF